MVSTFSGFEREFILGLVDDLRGYVVLGNSTASYFDLPSVLSLSGEPSRRDKLVFGDRFLDFEEALIQEKHRLKREGTHENVRYGLAHHAKRRGGEVRHLEVCKAHKNIQRDVRALHRLNSLKRFGERGIIVGEGLTELQLARALSLRHPVTLLTTDQQAVREYVNAERNGSSDCKRFEMALLYPAERSFSYFYPELVRSERFNQSYELLEVA